MGHLNKCLRRMSRDIGKSGKYFKDLPDEHKHCAKLAVMTLEAAIEKYQGDPSE